MIIWIKENIATIISVIALISSVFAYWRGLIRERKTSTLLALSEIRIKYPAFHMLLNKDKLEYIQRMEFFATGVNEGIYDINIVKKISGKRLISQYDNYVAKFFAEKTITEYTQYRNMIKKIKKEI